MICKNCGTEIPGGKFCTKCGTKVPEEPAAAQPDNFCASCKAPSTPGAKFCHSCGARFDTPPAPMPEQARGPAFSQPFPGGEPDKKKPAVPIIIIAAVLLLAGSAFWFFHAQKNSPAPAGLLVKTEPGNVNITLDGQPIGQTDDSGNLLYEGIAPGLRKVLAHMNGYADSKHDLQFTSGEQQELRLVLEPLPASLMVVTNPGNAYITLDDQPIGTTDHSGNLLYEGIAPGRHDVTARLDNYADAKQTLQFTSGEQQEAVLILEPSADIGAVTGAGAGKPKPPPANPPAKTNPVAVNAAPKPAAAPVNPDENAGTEQDAEFTADEQQEESPVANLPTGSLSVDVNTRNADIRIRGVGVLETHRDQITDMELPAGSYTITVSKSGYRSSTKTVRVRANADERVSIVLESAYSGPMSGMMVWTGDIRGTATVTIENGKASTGRVTGNPLPGAPCSIQLSDYRNVAIVYMPGPENDYKRVVFQVNSRGRISVTLRWMVLR